MIPTRPAATPDIGKHATRQHCYKPSHKSSSKGEVHPGRLQVWARSIPASASLTAPSTEHGSSSRVPSFYLTLYSLSAPLPSLRFQPNFGCVSPEPCSAQPVRDVIRLGIHACNDRDRRIIGDPISAALQPEKRELGELGARSGRRHPTLGGVEASLGQRVPEIAQACGRRLSM